MNKKISWKVGAAVIAAALATCAFVYSRIPTGMVVHLTGTMGKRGRASGASAARNHPNPQRNSHGLTRNKAVQDKDSHLQKRAKDTVQKEVTSEK